MLKVKALNLPNGKRFKPLDFKHKCVFQCVHICYIFVCCDVRYKLLQDFANWLEITEDTGLIKVRSSLDREASFIRNEQYTVLVLAYDNGNVNKAPNA